MGLWTASCSLPFLFKIFILEPSSRCYWQQVGRGRDGAKHPMMHRAAPHDKEFASPQVTGAKAARVWVQFRAGVTLPDKVPDINSEHDRSKSALHDETDQRTCRAGTGDRLSSTSVQESEAAIG